MVSPKAGIHGWGAYIPIYRLPLADIAKIWGWHPDQYKGLAVESKAVAGPDEDSLTMGYEAAYNAIKRSKIEPKKISAIFFGTESKPYAVKPSATIIGEALGITPFTMASDLEFACRAASEGMRSLIGMASSGLIDYGLAIGSDTAQANPGDVLEFTAASGAAAFVIGRTNNASAIIEDSVTFVTDTPDFWRRASQPYPLHGEGFTGEPAYFYHIENAVKALLERNSLKPSDFDYAIFHQPNGKFPVKVGQDLGFNMDQMKDGLVTPMIGNTYNASALMGLARVLDKAKPGQKILLAPFGSGAGSDAYFITVTDEVENRKQLAPTVEDYLNRKVLIDYASYAKSRSIIHVIK
ncbi:MAG: hydroxymethylglutaryl-CoA synthase [Caldisphaera sp.]